MRVYAVRFFKRLTSSQSEPGPAGGAGDGQGGGRAGDGGGLPVTGPAGVPLAGVGAALIVLGVAGFLLGRRRSGPFEG